MLEQTEKIIMIISIYKMVVFNIHYSSIYVCILYHYVGMYVCMYILKHIRFITKYSA